MRTRIAAVAAVSAAVLALVAAPARADSATPLPLTAAADVAVAGTKVFVSGGNRSTQVVVTSAAGAVTKTVGGLNGPTVLLPSADATKVYVVQQNINYIAVIDVATAKVTTSYATGAGICPRSLAQSGHYLYFGYNCAAGGNRRGGVGRIDLNAPAAPVLGLTGDQSPFNGNTPLLAAANGVWMAGGSDATYDPDVWLFKNGVASKNVELGAQLLGGGLAWATNSKRLYAVTFDVNFPSSGPPVLHVLDIP